MAHEARGVAHGRGLRPARRAACGAGLLLVALMTGCGESRATAQDSAPSAPLPVFVSILPQAYFVERVAGARVGVEVLVQPGQNPHNFDATPQQVVRLSRARAYFAIGVEFEPAVLSKLAAEGGPQIVRMQEGVSLLSAEAACAHPEHGQPGHDHDHASHAHGLIDPHIWLDPKRVKTVVANTRAALVRLDPAGQAVYEQNAAAFLKEIDELDAEIAGLLKLYAGREFFVYHPAYGYFAAAYGLKQVAIEREGKSPQGRELTELIRRIAASGTRTIFYEPQFDRTAMEVVAQEIGARAVMWDGLSRDWASSLRQAARDLVACFEARKP